MSQCLSKIPYANKDLAERAAEIYTTQSKRKGGNNRLNGRSYGRNITFRAYRCNICRKWHLSSQPKKGNK